MSIQNYIITSGAIFSSLYLFRISLNNLNKIFTYEEEFFCKHESVLTDLIIINSFTLFFSGFSFGYFAYNAIK